MILRNKWLIIFFACFALAASIHAEGSAPVIYNRTIIHIIPKAGSAAKPQAESKDAKDKKDDKDKKTDAKPAEQIVAPRTAKEFVVDIRPLQFLSQEGFIAQQPFTDKGGMMTIIDPPETTVLKRTNFLAKADVLFVRKDGIITKIAPGISLSTLEEPVSSDEPIHAFLFLKANTARLRDIQPGDHIENPLFRTHPVILQESTPPEPSAQQQAPK